MSARPPRPTPGSALSNGALLARRYVVRELLGCGGMGFVYRVFDTARGSDVALKQLRLEPSQPEAPEAPALEDAESGRAERSLKTARSQKLLGLFQREYQTLAELAHPHIIEAYDYGLEGGVPYYTMELLTGCDIGALAPAPWRRVCAILRDVASALTLLHSRGVLHRDISPSNVHEQRDGTRKLIDFGAMAAMGRADSIIGTPPFMAPELLRQGPLDARADLYSLAALGYFLLTGHTVHPARTLAERYNHLERRAEPPSVRAPDVPRALDELLVQLLSPDPALRPASTIEVVERLNAIDDAVMESRAHGPAPRLGTPALVGRETELKLVRRRLGAALRESGGALLVAAPAGGGRTRFLNACALEGRLLGIRVLSCTGGAASDEPYGLIKSLLGELEATLGSGERSEHAFPSVVSRELLDTAGAPDAAALLDAARERPPLQLSLLDYLSSISAARGLLLTVDELEKADEASLALLGALAQRAANERLLIIASIEADALASPRAGLHRLRAAARELRLPPLAAEHSHALLQSLFGDVPNLASLSTRIHGLGAGNARLTVELAHHLLQTGVIRCETFGYLLPERIPREHLPDTLGEALRARVRRLSKSAQSLAATLAVCAGEPLSERESYQVSGLGEGAVSALRELVDAQIAERRGDEVRLRQAAMADALSAALAPDERRALHERVAAQLIGDAARRLHAADHYFQAERPAEAVDALLAVAESHHAGRVWYRGYRSLLERGMAACAQFGRPAQDSFVLQNALVQHVVMFHEQCERAQLLEFSERLCRLSGLSDYHEIDEELEPQARLFEALRRARARYDATPPSERVLAPEAAIRQLVSFLSKLSGFASTSFDLALLRSVPSLAPFIPLSPTIYFVETLNRAAREMREGQVERYLEPLNALMARLEQPDACGFAPAEARIIRVNLAFGVGLVCATLGQKVALAHADLLDGVPSQRINAWRVRQTAYLFLGDPEAAESCRRQVEALELLEGTGQASEGAAIETEALAYALAGDLLGLRRILPGIERMALCYPGWRPLLFITQANLQRARGASEQALVLFERALAELPPARHSQWASALGGKLEVLVELGRFEQARALGDEATRLAEAEGAGVIRHVLELPLAKAELALGLNDRAKARLARMIGENEALGIGGLYLGVLHEGSARCALEERDEARFAHHFTRTRELFGNGCQPSLGVRLDRLREQARRVGVTAFTALDGPETPSMARELTALAAAEALERPALALQILMRATGASEGHLYRYQGDELALLTRSVEQAAPSALGQFLLNYLRSHEVVTDETVDMTYATRLIRPDGFIEPALLVANRAGGERTIVAVAALSFSGAYRWPDPNLLALIAEQLAP